MGSKSATSAMENGPVGQSVVSVPVRTAADHNTDEATAAIEPHSQQVTLARIARRAEEPHLSTCAGPQGTHHNHGRELPTAATPPHVLRDQERSRVHLLRRNPLPPRSRGIRQRCGNWLVAARRAQSENKWTPHDGGTREELLVFLRRVHDGTVPRYKKGANSVHFKVQLAHIHRTVELLHKVEWEAVKEVVENEINALILDTGFQFSLSGEDPSNS